MLAWIAQQVLQARTLQRTGDQQATRLVGGLAKNTRSEACRDAILFITHWLLGDSARRGHLNAIQLAMLLNALSKWPAHDDAKSLVLQLADFLASTPQQLQALDGQGVADVNVNLRPAGANSPGDFKIQFHTAQSLSTKLKLHRDYEKVRELPLANTRDERDEARVDFDADRERRLKTMRDATALVERPQGIETLISFDHYLDTP